MISVLGNFFNFLSIVNASCNFLLYCAFSKKFRSTFKKLFFERKKKNQDIIMLSSTKSKSSQKFNPYKHGIMRRNASEYQTPRNLEVTIYFFNKGKYINTYNTHIIVKKWEKRGFLYDFFRSSNLLIGNFLQFKFFTKFLSHFSWY